MQRASPNMTKVDAAPNAKTKTFMCERGASCDPALLKRIRQGVLDSKFTPTRIKDHCRKLWGGMTINTVLGHYLTLREARSQ